MSQSKKGLFSKVSQQVSRGTQLGKAVTTVAGGLKKAYNIGAFKEPPRDILPKYINVFCRKMVQSFGVEVVEVEPVPQTHALWAGNHISWMDIPVFGSVAPIFFISKAEIAKWAVIGSLAKAGGTLFINRGSGDAGSVSEQMATFMEQGSSIVFFPEATTTNGHKVKNIHGKLLQSAMKTGLPIQPMVMCYVNADGTICDDIAYYGDITMKESVLKVLDCKKITVYVLPLEPILPEDRSQEELTKLLQTRLQEGLTKLQMKVLKNKPQDAIWTE